MQIEGSEGAATFDQLLFAGDELAEVGETGPRFDAALGTALGDEIGADAPVGDPPRFALALNAEQDRAQAEEPQAGKVGLHELEAQAADLRAAFATQQLPSELAPRSEGLAVADDPSAAGQMATGLGTRENEMSAARQRELPERAEAVGLRESQAGRLPEAPLSPQAPSPGSRDPDIRTPHSRAGESLAQSAVAREQLAPQDLEAATPRPNAATTASIGIESRKAPPLRASFPQPEMPVDAARQLAAAPAPDSLPGPVPAASPAGPAPPLPGSAGGEPGAGSVAQHSLADAALRNSDADGSNRVVEAAEQRSLHSDVMRNAGVRASAVEPAPLVQARHVSGNASKQASTADVANAAVDSSAATQLQASAVSASHQPLPPSPRRLESSSTRVADGSASTSAVEPRSRLARSLAQDRNAVLGAAARASDGADELRQFFASSNSAALSGAELGPLQPAPEGPGSFAAPVAIAPVMPQLGSADAALPRAALPPAQPVEAVPQQIQLLAAEGGGRARLRLHPARLGEVEITVTTRAGNVDVVIRAEEPAAQAAVMASREQLVEALGARELRMSGFEVSGPLDRGASDGAFQRAPDRESREQRPADVAMGRETIASGDGAASQASVYGAGRRSESSIDLRI